MSEKYKSYQIPNWLIRSGEPKEEKASSAPKRGVLEWFADVTHRTIKCHVCPTRIEQATAKWVKMSDGCAHALCRKCADKHYPMYGVKK